MGLDREEVKISTAMNLAKEFYNEKTYEHAARVAGYVSESMSIPPEYRDACVALAYMHDLLEDTDYNDTDLPESFGKALRMLTKSKDVTYDDYCKSLRCTDYTNYKLCAYWVKLADMKDHLTLVDTLTDKLKEKYLSGLRYLL